VCEAGESAFFRSIEGYDYLQCGNCGSLHIDNATLHEIDAGKGTRIYDEAYWRTELIAAKERSLGVALVRAGEAILFARRPVRSFLDVGTGPGYLLDELVRQFPQHAQMFHGVELFPPEQHSHNANYHVGDVGSLGMKFDGGVCIEVIEHLTPAMLMSLVGGLACVSEPGALWLFNTGMPEVVLQHDPEYLDPRHRGHIVSYSLAGLKRLFEPHGFRLSPVPGKNYLFIAEYLARDAGIDFEQRIRKPLRENETLLEDAGLIHQAALESTRNSLCEEHLHGRTQWALSLQAELERACRLFSDLQAEHQKIASWAHSLDCELHEQRTKPAGCGDEHASLRQQKQSLDVELATLRETHTALQAEHDRIMHSRSWMLTRPLRGMASWWQGVRHASNRSGGEHEPH
jgi:hypothetical protein